MSNPHGVDLPSRSIRCLLNLPESLPPRKSRKMNTLAFGLLLICCHAWASEIDDNFLVPETYKGKSKLENALEKFKSTIRNGDTRLGIPPLDPFTADKLPINLHKTGKIDFDADFTNLKVNGLSAYTVNSANFKVFGLKLNMDISWPMITAATNYSMKGSAAGLEVYGNGGMNAAAHNFRFQINISFTLKKKHIQVKSMSASISLGALDFHATGLYGDDETSELVSKTVSEMVPKLIKENQKLIVDNFIKICTQMLNKYLSTITLKDLLKMLGL